MTNPEIDALAEVEFYLIAVGGLWALIPSSLDISIRQNTQTDGQWPSELVAVLRKERECLYERAIRDFAKQCAALRDKSEINQA